MKTAQLLWLLGSLGLTWPVWGQSGLKGDYYTGTNFEHKVFTRIDPAIQFDWRGRGPGPNMPESYYSIRWTGKLLAPVSGEYKFSAKVDDGIRVWVGNKKVIESWQLNDSKGFVGSIALEAGHFYDLRVDYFNDMLEGEIELYWQRPDAKKSIQNPFGEGREPIATRYFFQKADPIRVTLIRTPTKPETRTSVTVSSPPKAIPPKRPVVIATRPAPELPTPKSIIADTPTTIPTAVRQPMPAPTPELKPGSTFILHNVKFEQSSYVLLPESTTELNQLVTVLKKNPAWHIDVAGHTDNVGDPRLNQALSENRARVVAHYLIQRGIADDRIFTVGYGGARPTTSNATEGERSLNRRVEITIK